MFARNNTPNPPAQPSRNRPSAAPLVVEGGRLAMLAALARPDLRFLVFEPTWPDVDRTREAVTAAGLDHRITVHHRDARRHVA